MTVLIKNGIVVSPTGIINADVLVDGERIAAVLSPGDTSLGASLESTADRVIDAAGKYVIPGGVDCHTHMELPFGGTFASDTFETGTRAAAWGGTTTIIDFAVQKQGERVQDGLAAWHERARGECHIDYGFHQVIGGVDDDSLKAMDELVDEGVTSFKLFMAYPGVFYSDDGQILRAMQTASNNGSMIMMHAENGIAIDVLIAQALAEGKTDPKYHSLTRPWETEAEATNRAIMLARMTGAPLYIVHMSAKQAVKILQETRDQGCNVFGVVSTDHCPFCFKEQKELGLGDFSKIPNGIGTVEHRMDLIYQGVVDGQITLERWVELCATTPARMFGLYGRKGAVQPGFDADIVIYDPAGRTEIGFHKTHHMNMDHSAWEGVVIDGHVDTVISRGRVVVENNEYYGAKGHGQYLKRGLSQYLL